ncbi:hypothetical protein BDV37DRAFT_290564 [Aspergillus pseudonomiae]|uniref:C2H2-type domain-containing protein n=1 Tax=Aspergillus pseudonomiae TaxID=1506151 RepID=A0A5N7CYI7_9EURO|nr:uncharacterized protein BDV37DRAFT_290564 [Aspergillus pseudonomiae]KAE8399029.1 hypothetical protein BDV37DRAFT_290564 [Aspergillus pseudonomiae]
MRYSNQQVGSDDDSGSDTELSEVFSDDGNNDSLDSVSEPDSGDDASDDSNDDSTLDDVEAVELSAEHYLQEADCLDVSRLRQKRYSPRTQEKLDKTRDYWECFCRDSKYDPVERFRWLSDSEETVRFLKAFFSWRCDRRRGKKGRKSPGIKYKSSLETFWKWWHLVYKAEIGQGLSKDTTVKILDVLAIIAEEKKLRLGRRPKATMYIEDVAEFARVLLSTTEMTFECGWLRVQVLLYCQLAAITGSRPGALLNLRYRDLLLTLIRDPEGGSPRLFIYLTPEFTKTFLVLSPHVFLLGMLFRIKAFKSFSTDGPVVDCPENLYTVGILGGLGQQELKLKDEILDQFVFCQVVREADGFRIALEKQLTGGFLRYRMRRGGEITGFEQVTKPYGLRYGAAKAFNDSPDVTNELQNVMLQHASINTFIKHYSVGIHVDAQAIVRGLPAAKQLLRFAASMSRSIDPRRPYKLNDTSCVNEVPCVLVLKKRSQARKNKLHQMTLTFETAKQAFEQTFGAYKQGKKIVKEKYNRAQRTYRNEWQRQRNRLVRENLERYKNEQPVIDVERQLAGKFVAEDVMGALQRTGYMTPQHMTLIDAVLTMPGATVKEEYQRRISAINAVITFCDVQEGCPTRQPNVTKKRHATDALPSAPVKRQGSPRVDGVETGFRQAMASVCIKSPDERSTICFLCVANPKLPATERLRVHSTPGSLTRHFIGKHVKHFPKDVHVRCNVCSEDLPHKSALMNHAERVHGIVSHTNECAKSIYS